MNELKDLLEYLAQLPPGVLAAIQTLAAFGLAGFAIYAVLVALKGKRE